MTEIVSVYWLLVGDAIGVKPLTVVIGEYNLIYRDWLLVGDAIGVKPLTVVIGEYNLISNL
ncbi:MAG: hypothetical protein ACFFD2_16975 [Promethearchaeota archaeon]